VEIFQDNYKLLLAECERDQRTFNRGKLVAVHAVLCRGKERDRGCEGLASNWRLFEKRALAGRETAFRGGFTLILLNVLFFSVMFVVPQVLGYQHPRGGGRASS